MADSNVTESPLDAAAGVAGPHAVDAFYHEHGFDMTFGLDDAEDCDRVRDRLVREQTLVSEDPVRIRVAVPCDGDELHQTLDGTLDVIGVTEPNG